jgi:hypothetical protein
MLILAVSLQIRGAMNNPLRTCSSLGVSVKRLSALELRLAIFMLPGLDIKKSGPFRGQPFQRG